MILFRRKFWDRQELVTAISAAETLDLNYDVDWDARECSVADMVYEITVYGVRNSKLEHEADVKQREGKWVLKYYRHGREYDYEDDTKDEVLEFGCNGEDYGDLSMSRIIDPNGNEAMDGIALSDYYCTKWGRE